MNGNGSNIGGGEIKKSGVSADGARASHEILLRGRKNLSVGGVSEMISFDESSVVAMTACGELTVEGAELHIDALDTDRGILAVSGNICGVFYLDDPRDAAPIKRRRLFGHRV